MRVKIHARSLVSLAVDLVSVKSWQVGAQHRNGLTSASASEEPKQFSLVMIEIRQLFNTLNVHPS